MNKNISKINDYLMKQLWMDFELCRMDGGEIALFGYFDEMGPTKVKITFKQPYLVSCALFFTYEGNGEFLTFVEGEEAITINKKYGVTKGNQIFRISNTNIPSEMHIIAEELEIQIMEYQDDDKNKISDTRKG